MSDSFLLGWEIEGEDLAAGQILDCLLPPRLLKKGCTVNRNQILVAIKHNSIMPEIYVSYMDINKVKVPHAK